MIKIPKHNRCEKCNLYNTWCLILLQRFCDILFTILWKYIFNAFTIQNIWHRWNCKFLTTLLIRLSKCSNLIIILGNLWPNSVVHSSKNYILIFLKINPQFRTSAKNMSKNEVKVSLSFHYLSFSFWVYLCSVVF